jgi:hypothetical protein
VRWTGYDGRTTSRAAATATLLLVLAWLVTAATDEGGLALAERAARVLPLAPACAGLGAWLALARGRARGERLALEALGQSPWQSSVAAIAGAGAVALVCALFVAALRSVDMRGFYPAVEHAATYRYEGGAFVDDARGIVVGRDGAITTLLPMAIGRIVPGCPAKGRLAASLTIALAGFAFPMVAARVSRGTMGRAGLALGATLVASIILFHGAAAGRVHALACALPSMMLLSGAMWTYRESTRGG